MWVARVLRYATFPVGDNNFNPRSTMDTFVGAPLGQHGSLLSGKYGFDSCRGRQIREFVQTRHNTKVLAVI